MGKGLPRSRARGKPTDVTAGVRRLLVPIKNLAVLVANGSSAQGVGSAVVGDFPSGKLMILGTVVKNLVFSTADADATATWDGDFSLGSAPSADATLNGAEVDLLASTAIGAATAKTSPTQNVNSTQTEHAKFIDNSDGSKEINLNLLVDDASQSGDISMVVNGIVEIAYLVF